MYRRCAGRKDYTGETNWIDVERVLAADGTERFLQSLKVVGGLVLPAASPAWRLAA